MKRFVVWAPSLLVLICLGCAQAPMVDGARPYTFETGRTPYSAAICIARNARSMPGVGAEERLQGDAAWEVVVREASRGASALAVADIQPRDSGSSVMIRIASAQRGEHEPFVLRLMSDCQARRVDR